MDSALLNASTEGYLATRILQTPCLFSLWSVDFIKRRSLKNVIYRMCKNVFNALVFQHCMVSTGVLEHYNYASSIAYYNNSLCIPWHTGDRHMTINIHSLLHLCDDVRDLGPLWSHSCFPFENMNGILKNMYHGSQHIDKQASAIH